MPAHSMPSNDEETPVLNSTKLAKKSGSTKKAAACDGETKRLTI